MRDRRIRPEKRAAAVPSRREALIAGASLIVAPFFRGLTATAHGAQGGTAPQPAGPTTEWASYGGDKASTKYSPLAQIDRDNFSRLRVAWTWRSADDDVVNANPQLKTWVWEATPLMVDGVLYVSHVALAGGGDRRGDGQDAVGLRPGDVEERHAVQQRLRASRRRLLGGRERSTHPVRHRRRLPDLPECARPASPFPTFGEQGPHRSDPGVGTQRRPASLRRVLAADHLSRRHRDGVEGSRRSRRESDAARRRARLRRPHRQAAVAVPGRPRRRRVRERDLGGRLLEDDRRHQRLDAR